MCKYCELSNPRIVDGPYGRCYYSESKNEITETRFETCKIANINGKYVIRVYGNCEEFSEPIKYCPFCGKYLNAENDEKN